MGGRGYYRRGGLFARFWGGDWNHEVIFKLWWRGEDIFVTPEICKQSGVQTCKCISAKILEVKSAKFERQICKNSGGQIWIM